MYEDENDIMIEDEIEYVYLSLSPMLISDSYDELDMLDDDEDDVGPAPARANGPWGWSAHSRSTERSPGRRSRLLGTSQSLIFIGP
jgi:hypothetical protein